MRTRRRLKLGLALGTILALAAAAGQLAVGASADPDGPALRASAQIAGPGGISGEVRFTQTHIVKGSPVPTVFVEARVEGLSPGAHGFHIHENGACAPTFLAAGGHFDPSAPGDLANAQHPFHMGELPALVANAAGVANLEHRTSRITLSPGLLSIFDANGSAVIVHLNPDLGLPGPGAGGPRIACGVIQAD